MKVTWEKILFPALLLGTTYVGYEAIKDSKNYKGVDDLKAEMMQKDPARYDSIINSRRFLHTFNNWEYEVRLMNEALKTDSLVKKSVL